MKSLNKFLILTIFLIPSLSFADTTSNCVTYAHNFILSNDTVTTGFTGLTDFSSHSDGSALQHDYGNIDCVSSNTIDLKDKILLSLSSDNSNLYFFVPSGETFDFVLYNWLGENRANSTDAPSSGYFIGGGEAEGQYYLSLALHTDPYNFFYVPIWEKDNKLYLTNPFNNSATTNEQKPMTPTDIVMLIFLTYATIAGIVYIFNKIT